MRLLSLSLLLLMLVAIGCGPSAPSYTAADLTGALSQLESQTEAILEAFEANDLMTADKVMHDIPKVYDSVKRVVSGFLDEPVAAEVQKAVQQHLAAMGELHAPLHRPELPEDFELGPIREKALAAIEAIHAALPADLAAQLKAAASQEDAHDHGDEGHDHDAEPHGDERDGEAAE